MVRYSTPSFKASRAKILKFANCIRRCGLGFGSAQDYCSYRAEHVLSICLYATPQKCPPFLSRLRRFAARTGFSDIATMLLESARTFPPGDNGDG